MSFDAIESSRDDGRAIYLYLFTLGTTEWRYTSANDNVTIGGEVWEAVPISDDGVKQTGESVTDALNITAPVTIGPVQLYFASPPSSPVLVTILHAHRGETEAVAVYSGEINQVNLGVPGQATILCETISASMKRDGLRLAWQRGCTYALYDPVTCKVNKEPYAATLRILAIDGYTVTTDAAGTLDDDHFAGGFVSWTDDIRGVEFRGIESHTGNDLLIFGRTDGLSVGMVVTAYPGCSRTVSTCKNKFNNLANYGGVPHFPGRSPFDGNPVFN